MKVNTISGFYKYLHQFELLSLINRKEFDLALSRLDLSNNIV